MKLIDLVNAQQALRELSGKKLPVKTSYRVAKMLKGFTVELEAYEAQRLLLLNQFGTPGERTAQGVSYDFGSPENAQAYNDALAPLNQEEIQPNVELISIEDLGDVDLEPGLMFTLIGVLLKD